MRTASALCVLLCVVIAQSASWNWTNVRWEDVPIAKSTDVVEMYYLSAPLMKDRVGPYLGYLGLYHGALAFTNRNNNYTFTMNYNAADFLHSNLFPEITKQANGTKTLTWNSRGSLELYTGMYNDYWTKTKKSIGYLPGNIFNKFMSGWVSQVNQSHPFYNMISIQKPSLFSPGNGDVFLPSWSCFDFCAAAFAYLGDIGAKFTQKTFDRDSILLFTRSPPIGIPFEENSKEIIAFYEFVTVQFTADNFYNVFNNVLRTMAGKWIFYHEGTYYRVALALPYGRVRYHDSDIIQ